MLAAILPIAGIMVASAASPAFADQTITTPGGPITRLLVTDDLNCGVSYLGDSDPEFFGDTACGTFLGVGGTVYGPASVPAGGSFTPYTPVSQTLTGSGTPEDPAVITTVVTAGDSATVTQTDSYIAGQNAYQTNTTVTNDGSTGSADVVLYHAGDCFLQDSDQGFGEFDPVTGAVTCRGSDDGGITPGSRVEQFVPLSEGSRYLEDLYFDVWDAVRSGLPLPNSCAECDNFIDNGMALSWSAAIPVGASVTRSLLTNFSPLGLVPLVTTTDAQPSSVAGGDSVDITLTVDNPNTVPASLASLTVTIPSGAAYVPGSTQGAPEPTIDGNTLTFAGPLGVPVGGSITVTFSITAPAAAGDYDVSTAGDAGAVPVLPSSDSFTVEGGGGNQPPVAADDSYTTTADTTLTVPAPGVLANDTDPDGDSLTADLVSAPANGALTLDADGSFTYTPDPGFIGTDAFTYTANDGALESDPATVAIDVTPEGTPLRCTILGSPNDDVLVGGQGDDIICGVGGDDLLIGNGGNDVMFGGEGNDRLYGGAGDDVMLGVFDDDQLFGGYGDDLLIGGFGVDYLVGGSGDDRLFEGPRNGVPH